jgi:hypothetical protein
MTDGTGVSGVPVMMFRESNPADRLTSYTDSTGRYAFYNCRVNTPLIVQSFAPEGKYFSQAVDVSADFVAREIKTPDWMELTVQLHPGDNITADFELTDMPVAFYGAIYDTNLMSIPGVWVFVSTVGGSVVAQQQTTEFGFAFFNLSPQDYQISMLLPTDSNGYHWPTQMLESNSVKERIDTIAFSGTPVRLDYHAVSGNSPFFAFIEAGTNERLAGGQVELNLPGTQDNPFISIISGANGFVSFDEQDLTPGQLYDVMVTAPPGYHCQNSCLMNFTWYGNQQLITPLYMVAD